MFPRSSNPPATPYHTTAVSYLARPHDNRLVSVNACPDGKILKSNVLKCSFVSLRNQALPVGPWSYGVRRSLKNVDVFA